ncbi:polyprenyl-pyrophosphate binding protein [Legionella beliardensis]|uniref:Polyprenyl-pyrophosphate binding protein n=1 Tax=Legionella beliardensis TaxID=91822 RepID=A0A378I6M9_9GAMM|nr:YceI family protein [Legionella beliardensis]STX28114.1 polyprenyl-pyrophosphate binding protein [Legionella beliardensis]
MAQHLNRLFLVLLISLVTFSSYAAEKWILDNQHTYVLWTIKHLNFSYQTGKWFANGEIIFDPNNPQNSKVTASIQVADVVTGIPELDKHLREKLFFDTAKYPTATFSSNRVEMLSKNTAKVHGTLTLRGVTKPVTLDVMLNNIGKHPMKERMTAGFSATTTIKRSDFGMTNLQEALGDDVKIEIGAEAYQVNPTQS